MKITKRQLIESKKRSSLMWDLLTNSDKNQVKEMCTSYKDGTISLNNGDIILGHFSTYKELKSLQDSLIKLFRTIDHYYFEVTKSYTN